VVTISATGQVQAVAPGTVVIRATSGNVFGEATLQVNPPVVASVIVSATSTTIASGGTSQATAVLRDAQNAILTGRTITWRSLNETVATVSATTGLITAVAAGNATIRATSEGVNGDLAVTVTAPAGFVRIDTGGDVACAVTAAGAAWCWGDNFSGELGGGTAGGHSAIPVRVAGSQVWVTVQPIRDHEDGATCGLTTPGEVWCWGWGGQGELGRGPGFTGGSVTPGLVTGNHVFVRLESMEEGYCGIKSNSETWCWGSITSGALGTAGEMERFAPTRIVSQLSLTQVVGGTSSVTCGLTTIAEVWCWGYVRMAHIAAPIQITGLPPISHVASSGLDGCGVTSAGAVWCWNIAFDQPHTPTLLGGGHQFMFIEGGGGHYCGLKANGEAWCWGNGSLGGLGDGSQNVTRPEPVRVNGGHLFTSITVADWNHCGRKANGELWCWGYNWDGEIGDGTFLTRLEPVKVLTP